jgi:hypothetical protein
MRLFRLIIWIDALHQVCLDNISFLPIFPIDNMSALELEQAVVMPGKWLRLCACFDSFRPHFSSLEEMSRCPVFCIANIPTIVSSIQQV